jgi:hypothetical protein
MLVKRFQGFYPPLIYVGCRPRLIKLMNVSCRLLGMTSGYCMRIVMLNVLVAVCHIQIIVYLQLLPCERDSHGESLRSRSHIMVVSRQSERLHIDVGGQELKQVEQFKYLGSHARQHSIKETAINEKIYKYSKNFGLMYPLLKDRHVPISVKVTVYKKILQPTLT